MTAYQVFLLLYIKAGISGSVDEHCFGDIKRLHELGLIDNPTLNLGFRECKLTSKGNQVVDTLLNVAKTVSE